MKKKKLLMAAAGLLFTVAVVVAADHIDAPAVKGGTADITDYYAFQGENTNNLVFVANVQGLIAPMETSAAMFDENVLVEFNIDSDGDLIEDYVIQAIPRDGKMYFFGPFEPASTGLNSVIGTDAAMHSVAISQYGQDAEITTDGEMKFFAGPRDDPFFFDFGQYTEILSGNATSFNDPGDDTFAGTNVMSIVVEVPKSMFGNTPTLNTWVETKTK